MEPMTKKKDDTDDKHEKDREQSENAEDDGYIPEYHENYRDSLKTNVISSLFRLQRINLFPLE